MPEGWARWAQYWDDFTPEVIIGYPVCMNVFPATLAPQLAGRVSTAPAGADWLHEIKYDGFRLLCRRDGNDIRFFTRNGYDWTRRLNLLKAPVTRLPEKRLWLDGELCVLLPDGRSCFGSLQNALTRRQQFHLFFMVFDLMFLGNESLLHVSLLERKELLRSILKDDRGNVRFVDYIHGHGQDLFRYCCDLNMEGIISKRIDSACVPGERPDDWLKVKNPRYHLVRTGDPDYFDRKKMAA